MNPRFRACAAGKFAAILLGSALTAAAYIQVPPPEQYVLPEALSPQASLETIQVPERFQVELVAAEPLVMDPIDVAWGADGRLWVVEMADYPDGMDGQGEPGGRIRVLESSRSDGTYDRSTLFAEGLPFPTSVLPWRRGILVTAAPDILYLEDTNGDGRADRIEQLFTGFREGNQQHRVNTLQWGLDGWVYVANGDSGGTVRSLKTGQSVELGRRDLRIRPDEGDLEVASGRSQYGRNRDDWGNWFGGNNSNPIWHYALEDHYLRRNPSLVPPNAVVPVPDIPRAAPVYPISRMMDRFNDPHGANRFTSACGVMIYRDDFLGPDLAGNVFVCEPVHNLVNRQVLHPRGATFRSERAPEEQESEFFASSDNWARPTSVRTGPDGALYVVDMYRLVIEHPQWIPDAWQEQLEDLRAGADLGRIYRVVPKGARPRRIPRLDRADAGGLVVALENPSGTVRDLAHQELVWRRVLAAVPALEKLAVESVRPESRVQALCVLDGLDALRPSIVARALADPHAGVRRHAARLTEGFAGSNPDLLDLLVPLAADPDAFVRQQAAYSLGAWSVPAAGRALAGLLRTESDEFIRAAALSSAPPHAGTLLAELGGDQAFDRVLVEIAVATGNTQALAQALLSVAAPRPPQAAGAQFGEMAAFLDGLDRNSLSLGQLKARADPALDRALAAAAEVFVRARAAAAGPGVPLQERIAAASILGRGPEGPADDFQILAGLLAPQVPADVQVAAINAMGQLDRAPVPETLLARWDAFSPVVRAASLDLLISRPAWAGSLLDRLEADRTMLAQLGPAHQAALIYHSSSAVAGRAFQVLQSGVDSDRQRVIDAYLTAMEPIQGDAARGAVVFNNACRMCHGFGDTAGSVLGPDLASVNDRSRAYLVTHILDPNRAVEDRYMLYSATTRDGRTVAGILASEAGGSVTFVGLDGEERVILRSELRSLSTTGRSLMPDGLEGALDAQAMADLIAFIADEGR